MIKLKDSNYVYNTTLGDVVSFFMTKENILNFCTLSWSFAVISDYFTTALSILTGVTLVWMNVERALRARNNRKNEQNTHDE